MPFTRCGVYCEQIAFLNNNYKARVSDFQNITLEIDTGLYNILYEFSTP